jgi:hypothetical protein
MTKETAGGKAAAYLELMKSIWESVQAEAMKELESR